MTTWIEFTLGVHIKLPKSKLERDFLKNRIVFKLYGIKYDPSI